MNIEKFIPKSKTDTELIDELSNYEYPFYRSILKELFEWIQDINWPVAVKIVPLLVNAGNDVVPIVKDILASNDDIWKFWTLTQVIANMDVSVIENLRPELERIKNSPTDGEKLEEVNLIADELLNKLTS